jgi:type I restriction enzyme R subunit
VPETPFIKYRISGVTVKKIAERVQYYDVDGKLVTESFKDYTKKAIKKQFTSMDEFIKTWQEADRKQVIIDELESQGVIWSALEEDVSRDLDPFDLICHVAFDQPPLTRKERAENVRKRNYFTKYSERAQQVLNALLDKYADQGVSEIESIQVLKVTPFDQMGQPREIVKNAFGNKQAYEQAISELEALLYAPDQSA